MSSVSAINHLPLNMVKLRGGGNSYLHVFAAVSQDQTIRASTARVQLLVAAPQQRVVLNLKPVALVWRARLNVGYLACVVRKHEEIRLPLAPDVFPM